MKRQKKQKIENRKHPAPGSLARGGIGAPKNRRLAGENKRTPNLSLTLDSSQIAVAREALSRLHDVRLSGPYNLDGCALSINPVDVSTFLGLIERTSENELLLYGLRRQAIEQLTVRLNQSRSVASKKTYEFLIDDLKGTIVGRKTAWKKPVVDTSRLIDLLP